MQKLDSAEEEQALNTSSKHSKETKKHHHTRNNNEFKTAPIREIEDSQQSFTISDHEMSVSD